MTEPARRLPCALLMVAATSSVALAQQALSPTTGVVIGTVYTDAGTPVPACDVRLTRQVDGDETVAACDPTGRFMVTALRPGPYAVVVSHASVTNRLGPVYVSLAAPAVVEIRLTVGRFAETVDVAETPATVRPTHVTQDSDLLYLPADQRSYLSFAPLAAGATRDRGPQSGGAPTSGLSLNGTNPRYNSILLDGFDNNDAGVGAARAVLPQDAVQEYEILRSPYSAEYSQFLGGVVNVVTRSGAPRLDGSITYHFRDEALAARHALAAAKAPLSQHQAGGYLGGTLKRTRVFAAIDRRRITDTAVVSIDDAAAAALRAAGFPIETGSVAFAQRATSAFARQDTRWRRSDLAVRAWGGTTLNEQQQPFGGIVARSAGGVLRATDAGIGVSLANVRTASRTQDLRVWAAYKDFDFQSLDESRGVSILIQGVARVGTRQSLPQPRTTHDVGGSYTSTWSTGRALVKAGASGSWLSTTASLPLFVHGQHQFNASANRTALEAFVSGMPSLFIQAFGDAETTARTGRASAFAGLDLPVGARGLVSLGGRYDYERPVAPFEADANNWSPRAQVAWYFTPTLTIRAGGGRFYGVSPAFALLNVNISDGRRLVTVSRTTRDTPSPAAAWAQPDHRFASLEDAGATTSPQTIFRATPFHSAAADHGSLVIEKTWRALTITADYVHVRGRHQILLRDVNAIAPPGNQRPDPAFANIYTYDPLGRTWFDGVTLGAFAGRRIGRASLQYSFARGDDNYADWRTDFLPADSQRIDDERGPSAHVPRQRLVTSGITPPWTLGGAVLTAGWVWTIETGLPYNLLAGVDRNGNGDALSDRPIGVSRNAGRLPMQSQLDVRATMAIGRQSRRVEFIAEAFNVSNRDNVLELQNVQTQPGFMQRPLRMGEPRRIQLGCRLRLGTARTSNGAR